MSVTLVKFQRPETIVAELEVRNAAGVLTDPGTVPKITITDPDGTVQVDAASMTKTATGLYEYYFTPEATDPLGWYSVKYVVTDGARVTIRQDGFELEAS